MARKIIILALLMTLIAIPASAQGADGWTVYELNLRASPNGDVIGTIPVNTGMIFEARNADMSWLLGHSTDGAYRGLGRQRLSQLRGRLRRRAPARSRRRSSLPGLCAAARQAG